ncbi:hypothetical protein [Rothia kristinae]|uniref:hypothetical protein n=1 Tax=Rothia kristinae TaxID=37923 RepID=UPI002E2C1130|nr:hypothetical protein [Rothia kristinae]MED6046430.1 hypothetical protein [Rothia kristinae]
MMGAPVLALVGPVRTAALAAAEQSPSLKPGLDTADVSPGMVGFLATLVMVILVILVALDHTRRQRRMKNRFDYAMARAEQDRRRAEQPEERAGDGGAAAAAGTGEREETAERPTEQKDPGTGADGDQPA